MRKIYTIILASCFAFTSNAQNFNWVQQMGGSDWDMGYAIAIDADGNVYSTGFFKGTTDFDPSTGEQIFTSDAGSDIYVQKLGSNGDFLWAKQMGANSNNVGRAIATDADGNVYTTGEFGGTIDFDPGIGEQNLTAGGSNDIFIQKLDTNGELLWVKRMGGTGYDAGHGITIDTDGNVYTTGYFVQTVDFDPGTGEYFLSATEDTRDIFVQKLDADGNFIWAKHLGSDDDDLAHSITVDTEGNVYTVGTFRETVDFDPNAGEHNFTSAGISDIFIQKLDTDGNFIWAKQIGGTGFDKGRFITTDIHDNVYTIGRFLETVDFDPNTNVHDMTSAGSFDIFVQKLDTSGNFIWAKQMGGLESDYGGSISVDVNENVYVMGNFQKTADVDPGIGIRNLTAAGYSDIFIEKLDANGNFLWVRQIGGNWRDDGYAITTDANGDIYTTGRFEDIVDFDPGEGEQILTSVDDWDIFVQKFTQCTPLTGTDTQTACDTYTWIDGGTYTASNNTATFNVENGATTGCDSIITLDLTIINSATSIDSQTACDSFTWIDENTYNSNNNTATFDIPGGAANGCDSIIMLNLTINNSVTSTDTQTTCNSFTWIDGNTYNSSNNTAIFNIENGTTTECDSIVILDLTINSVSDVSTSTSDSIIIANNSNATYQWLDCENNYAPLAGETNQNFTPAMNGSYAVELMENGCIDTSACVIITTVGFIENSLVDKFNLFPNPTNGNFTIEFDNIQQNLNLRLLSTSGKLIESKHFQNTNLIQQQINHPPGIYMLEITDINGNKATLKLLKI